MKYSDGKENFNYYTGKASEVIRQLCLAGFALLWAFKPTGGEQSTVFNGLKVPITILAVSLSLDILQYVAGSILWYIRVRRYEKVNGEDSEKDLIVTPIGNLFMDAPFYLKICTTTVAYIWMAKVLLSEFVFP